MMREIEAFSYWPDHASAIYGFGGRRRSPDPRYCFHTIYNEVRPGPTRYVLRLSGVNASHGELTLRVHAFRPPDDVQISLVSGARRTLDDADQGDISVEVRFVALRGVVYAFYGYFSEDTDIEASHVGVELHEYEGEDIDAFVEPPRSALATDSVKGDARPANALIHFGTVDVAAPVSQDFTFAQLNDITSLQSQAAGLPADTMVCWHEQACLAMLSAYGAPLSGLDGLVLGAASEYMRAALADTVFIVRQEGDATAFLAQVAPTDFVDFLLWPEGPDRRANAVSRWEAVETAMSRLKIGGLAAIGLTYRVSGEPLSSAAAADHRELSRNEIGQWVLRLISNGFSVAPLAFAADRDIVRGADGCAAFVLVARRQ